VTSTRAGLVRHLAVNGLKLLPYMANKLAGLQPTSLAELRHNLHFYSMIHHVIPVAGVHYACLPRPCCPTTALQLEPKVLSLQLEDAGVEKLQILPGEPFTG